MDSEQFCLAIKTYLDLAQKDSDFLQRGNHLLFKQSLAECFQQFQINSQKILSFLAKKNFGKEEIEKEEEEEETEASFGFKESEETWKVTTSESHIWHLSTETFYTAERDLRCGSFILKKLKNQSEEQGLASQTILFFQQAAEKSIKSLWLLDSENAIRLLNSLKNDERVKEKYYFMSHNLVFLAKGLEKGNIF